ncbi:MULTISPECIES: TauD/TfdA dioxygenase family protein [Micromonospora]|uniref:TauD/TfdA dioxygenase family protein n=1 Tax=Micromonospora TaxID=1873 RepID=UPI001B36D283|nr:MULTISPECIES: TauD/TfdA family dioxygenase [Micromonospora]MBQ0981625.1 TauD/TfdA family dioxygenase [Micromonospora sp. M61]MBQ1037126.1 TauD/TfdA family dioxygenase [Micromonospora sp. C81]
MTHTIENPVNTRVRIRQVAGNIGAEILGVDASEDLSDDVIRELRQALLTHKVIFIRRQDLDYDRLVAFGKRFGTLTLGHPIYGGPEGKPLLREMDSRGEGTRANYWHADFTYMDNPPAFAFLHNVVCPEVGGDTIWANTGAAYRDLPEGLRTLADGLRVVHSNDSDFTDATYDGDVRTKYLKNRFAAEHPAVRVHPETGERCLLLGGFARAVTGYTPQAGRDLLRILTEYATKPEYTVRWKWQKGDLVIWDNQATLHYAIKDYTEHRRGERVTVAGTTTVGVDGAPAVTLQGNTSDFVAGAGM